MPQGAATLAALWSPVSTFLLKPGYINAVGVVVTIFILGSVTALVSEGAVIVLHSLHNFVLLSGYIPL